MQLGFDAGKTVIEPDDFAEEQVEARVEFVVEVGEPILQVA